MDGSEKPYLSFSQIAMYLRCPRQYWYRYREGKKSPPGGALLVGKTWHSSVALNYRQKIATDKDLPLSQVQEWFDDRFESALEKEEHVLEDRPGVLKDLGMNITAIHHKEIAPPVRPMIVEQKFRIDLGLPFDLLGYWDLVEKDGTLVDNKSYKRTPTQKDLDKDLQFTAYSLAFRETLQRPEHGLRMDAVIKTKTLKTVQLHTRRTEEELEWFTQLVKQVGEAILSENFFPNPNGWHCDPRWCGYYRDCKPH